jgi:tetratricopeptide (TPR) repeat protein
MSLATAPLDHLIEWLAEYFIKQAAQHGPHVVKSIWKQIHLPNRPRIFVPKSRLINRERELRAFNAALSENSSSRVIYLSGTGGAGKTRLLEEVGRRVNHMASVRPLRWGGILDLYHADLHSVTAVQTVVMQALDPEQEHFQDFRNALQRFQHQRHEGLLGPSLDKELEQLDTAFLDGYNFLASNFRLVLAFDTLESLNSEHELIQSLCHLPALSGVVRDWLVKWVSQINNSVVILAGRPQPDLRRDLERGCAHMPGQLEFIEVSGLTRNDSCVLLESFLEKAPTQLKALRTHSDQLWQVAGGLPVQLALIVELATQGHGIDLNGTGDTESTALWGKRLVGTFFRHDDLGNHLLFYLALTRKGLTIDLLNYLEPGWPRTECEQHLAGLRNLSVVKTRPGQEEIFLHDALYELFDAYLPSDVELAPWYGRIADYYHDLRARAGSDRDKWGSAVVSLLYYELQCNPLLAFESDYIRWDEEAIKGYEIELDMQLRDELLRFTRHPIYGPRATDQGLTDIVINQDSAIRWIKRYLARARYQQAATVAEAILSLAPEPLASLRLNLSSQVADVAADHRAEAQATFVPGDLFFWGHLLTYYGEALVFLGKPELQSQQILNQASNLLHSAPPHRSSGRAWLQERVLGRTYDRLGYLSRTYGHLGMAEEHYCQALKHFERPGLPDVIEDERATTLNNLAFVDALLGDTEAARNRAEQALELRRKLGQAYPIALSYNTRGLICALQGEYLLSRRDCEQALNIFEKLESARGIGLACNALGYLLRKQGEEWEAGKCEPGSAAALFEQADKHLQRAIEIFTQQVTEPVRLWETYNEKGSLYHSWGRLLTHRVDRIKAQEKFKLALRFQMLALQQARMHKLRFQMSDTCDDLAWVLGDQADMKRASRWLDRCLKSVPGEYLLNKGEGFGNAPEPGEAYWLILGKVHLRLGLWALQSSGHRFAYDCTQQAIESIAQAAIYFERYWPATEMLNRRLSYMSKCLEEADVASTVARELIENAMADYNIHALVFLEMFNTH